MILNQIISHSASPEPISSQLVDGYPFVHQDGYGCDGCGLWACDNSGHTTGDQESLRGRCKYIYKLFSVSLSLFSLANK